MLVLTKSGASLLSESVEKKDIISLFTPFTSSDSGPLTFLQKARPLLIIALFFLFCSPPPPVDPFVYRNEGIQIDLKADHMLNTFDGEAHSIKLGVYQLSNNTAFLERNITLKGCNELLKISKFDLTVVNYKQYIVNPSDSRLLIIDRAVGAKWIGVIAGYYTSHDSLPPSVLIEIPLITKRKTLLRRLLEFTGLLTPVDARFVPATLIELILTPTTMYETSVFR